MSYSGINPSKHFDEAADLILQAESVVTAEAGMKCLAAAQAHALLAIAGYLAGISDAVHALPH